MSKDLKSPGELSTACNIAFSQCFRRSLDKKKRFTMPSVWRLAFGDQIFVMPDVDRPCLQLIPQVIINDHLAELRQRPFSDVQLNTILEVIGSNSEVVEFDVQGRVRISDRMLDAVNITNCLELRGALRMVTMWACNSAESEKPIDKAGLSAAMRMVNF